MPSPLWLQPLLVALAVTAGLETIYLLLRRHFVRLFERLRYQIWVVAVATTAFLSAARSTSLLAPAVEGPLLAGAGFMVRNFLTHYRMDLGIDSSRLLTMQLGLPDRKYPALEQRLAFYQQLHERLQGNARIRGASVASNVPLQGGFARQLTIDGRPLQSGEQRPVDTVKRL